MRIISGKYKGRKLSPPGTFKARPTTDYARESLFNILSVRYDFEGMSVLDLFAGTGSIGLEFCSRGAENVTMVEINRIHANFIKQSITTLQADGATVFQSNIKDFIRRTDRQFDIIFADPPYSLKWLDSIPDLILSGRLMKQNGIFILEHPGNYNFNNHISFSEHRHYGSVNFSFFVNKQ